MLHLRIKNIEFNLRYNGKELYPDSFFFNFAFEE